jgi:hypothetical protein
LQFLAEDLRQFLQGDINLDDMLPWFGSGFTLTRLPITLRDRIADISIALPTPPPWRVP